MIEPSAVSSGLALGIATAGTLLAALLGAGVGGLIASRTTDRIDERARRRDETRKRASVRAATAFIRADLDASRRRLRQALEAEEWWAFYELPIDAWREHGPTIAPRIPPDEVAAVAHAFARLRDLQAGLATMPVRRAGVPYLAEGALVGLRFDKQGVMQGRIDEVDTATSKALSILEHLATR